MADDRRTSGFLIIGVQQFLHNISLLLIISDIIDQKNDIIRFEFQNDTAAFAGENLFEIILCMPFGQLFDGTGGVYVYGIQFFFDSAIKELIDDGRISECFICKIRGDEINQ